jgi:hypothetical protein
MLPQPWSAAVSSITGGSWRRPHLRRRVSGESHAGKDADGPWGAPLAFSTSSTTSGRSATAGRSAQSKPFPASIGYAQAK